MSVLPNARLHPKKPVIILCYRNPIAIIQHQLEYWFSKYPKGFYKFLEPCKHPLYKVGDSWTEEIGYSRPVFNKAFDTIGIRYNSKSEFTKAEDKFQGKLYASYYDRKTNKTFFIRNTSALQPKERPLYTKKPIAIDNPSQHVTAAQNQTVYRKQKRGQSTTNSCSRNETNNHSYGGTIGGKNKNSFTINSSSSSDLKNSLQKIELSTESKNIAEEMKKIWIEEIGECEINHLSSSMISRLHSSYSNVFDNSVEQWRIYCRKIASSKFLMGEGSKTFKVWFSWAIKPKSYERIQAGEFTLGDRKIVISDEQQKKESEKSVQQAKEEIKLLSKNPHWKEACMLIIERVGGYAANYLKDLDLAYLGNSKSDGYIAELKASSRFYKDYVQRNYQKEIHRALEEINGTKINYLNFTV